ncbi:cellulase family glycosylhydrolase [Pseudomonas sp. TMW22089]|uniref:glycoside hydrolase family 5 protein n=1 Tax=Pseudomonas sp. TMW22089 TaxID=2506433 RepID=UPI001F0EDBD2|nr:cellulase family glycosylhydrolase [Pseudomonas sp. TMW22089]MCH4870675.1 glycosyl hydrolase [Pseudomonas sp. TMW22089]
MKLRTMPALLLLGVLSGAAGAADMIAFWDKPERGGNSFNRLPPDQAYFDALQDYGANWVRLSYDKWQPAERDYLIGNADQYQGLVAKDLQQLIATLDRAHAAGLKVVITPLSLPGMRWAQNNGDRFDDRLWQDKRFWTQSAAFWRDLAAVLKEHPAVAAYNLINEPAPEKQAGLAEHADAAKMRDWYEKQVGSARDLPGFYQTLISAIREVDPLTPIMVDAGWYGAADAFSYWPAPLADSRVLYSFHMYEPYAATSAPNLQRARPYTYPGLVPFAAGMQKWDPNRVRSYLQLPLDWAAQHAIPANRMVAGEFGCMRKLPGCQQYLEDVLSALEAARVHWAFYSFREDSWDGMDYELGSANVPWAYWKAAEDGQPDPVKRSATAEFEPISKRLKKSE